MKTLKRQAIQALVVFVCSLSAPFSYATEWPQSTVRIIVPFSPGGNTDTMARLIAKELSAEFNASFIVENKAGAGGTIATQFVADAAPDGNTLLMGTLTQISTAPYTNKIRYDPQADLIPIANVGGNPFVITVRSGLPVTTIQELIEYAKEHPDELNIGNAGVGGLTHLSALIFAQYANIKLTEVPYQGASLALQDVSGGYIDLYSGNLSEVLSHRNSPKVRLLAISSSERNPLLPDVPALNEVLSDIPPVETWNGLLAPAGVPQEIVDKIASAVLKVQQDPAFQTQLHELGISVIPETTDKFAARIENDTTTWKPLLEAAGITPQ